MSDYSNASLPDGPAPAKGKPRSSGPRDVYLSICMAVLGTLVFYLEAIAAILSGSLNAGFVYTGDFWHACLAHLAKLNSFVSAGAFSGIDWSTHGGASEFFLRPNLYPYHPLALLLCFLVNPSTPGRLIGVSVLLLVAHSFAGCYFTIRLAARYFNMSMATALFIGFGYCFSVQMVYGLAYPPYVYCASVVPWAIYGALSISDRFTLRGCVLHSLPIFVMLTGGYVAIGVSCVVMALGFVGTYIFYIDDTRGQAMYSKIAKSVRASTPFVVAGIVAAPLYWAILKFHALVPTASVSLFWAAHQLSELPHNFLRLVSSHLRYSGPMYEFTVYWGIIPVVIVVLFFAGLRDEGGLSVTEWRLLKVCATVYFLIVLSIYGDYTAASDLLYFVPGIGTMHIYQRHLLAGHFFFILAVSVMLVGLMRKPRGFSVKVVMFLLLAVLAISAHLLAIGSPTVEQLQLNDYLVFEFLLGLLFCTALLFPGRHFPLLAGTFLMFLIPLKHIFQYSTSEVWSYRNQQSKQLVLDVPNNERVMAYFKRNSNKEIIKYLDLTPGLREYFSKNYPWFVSDKVQLSSYGGYEMQLAARNPYLRRMLTTVLPGRSEWEMIPDWTWVARTGGEFVVYQETHAGNNPRLNQFADTSDPARVLRFADNMVIAPLKFENGIVNGGERILFDNGYLRGVQPAAPLGPDLALGKRTNQSSTFASAGPELAIDGNMSGAFTAGSVTHTALDKNAWWQVDLGASFVIDSVVIWNRADDLGYRLSDYWLFASDQPFGPGDGPANLQNQRGVWAKHQTLAPVPSSRIEVGGIRGRYVRVQLSGANYLSLAEVQVFGASPDALKNTSASGSPGRDGRAVISKFHSKAGLELSADINATGEMKVQYLFWPNERLRFYVDGRPAAATVEDGLQTVRIPPGQRHFEIEYVYWPIRFFLVLYVLYALSVVAVLSVTSRSRAFVAGLWRRATRRTLLA